MINCKFKATVPFLAIFCLLSVVSHSQSLSITPNNTSFIVNSSALLTAGTTNTSAFTLNVISGSRSYSLSAAITAKNFNPSSTVFNPPPFTLAFRSVSSGPANDFVSGNIQLTESPSYAVLTSNANKTTNKTVAIVYDLRLAPLSFTYAPGTYNFTVTIQYNDGANNILQSFNISLIIQGVVSVALVQNVSSNISFASSANYMNGVAYSNFHTMQVRSNSPWLMSVAADAPFFTPGDQNASNNMPCSIMGIRVNGLGNYTPMSTTPVTLRSGPAGDINVGNNTTNYDMNFNPGWDYNAGIYNISVTYTFTNQ